MEALGTAVIVATVFYGISALIKAFTDYLLKRKIVKTGHTDKAGILDPVSASAETNRYPSLKWGLVALLAGFGFVIIQILYSKGAIEPDDRTEILLPFGIELIAIALGFLLYFFILNAKGRKM